MRFKILITITVLVLLFFAGCKKEVNLKDAEDWFNKGNALYKQGKYAEAIKCYDKAIESNPKHAEAWWSKGHALGNLGKEDEALKCLEKAVEVDPNEEGELPTNEFLGFLSH